MVGDLKTSLGEFRALTARDVQDLLDLVFEQERAFRNERLALRRRLNCYYSKRVY